MLLLALPPILAVAFLRSRLAVFAVLAGSALFAASAAYEIPLADARPRDPQRDFFGPVLDGIRQGFLDFYDTRLPFDRIDFQLMHALVLLAIFGFTALVGMLVVARKPIPAAARPRRGRRLAGDPHPRPAAACLPECSASSACWRSSSSCGATSLRAACSTPPASASSSSSSPPVASSTDAVAKPAFLSLADAGIPTTARRRPYRSVRLATRTTRHRLPREADGRHARQGVRAQAVALLARDHARRLHRRRLGRGTDFGDAEQREQIDAIGENSLLPRAATNEDDWVRQDITIEALRDTHLLASAQPVRWRPGTEAPVADADGDVVIVPDALRRNQRYTVWSYVPQANPSQLADFDGEYPAAAERYLEVVYEGVPAWNAAEPRRGRWRSSSRPPRTTRRSRRSSPSTRPRVGVTSGSRSPYEAAVAPRDVVPRGGRVHLRRAAAAADRRRAAARRLRQQHEARATASTTPAR